MRIHCSGMDGSDVEGEVIGGEFYDPDTGWKTPLPFAAMMGWPLRSTAGLWT